MSTYKFSYRKTKRGSVIKVRDYSSSTEPTLQTQPQQQQQQRAPNEDTKFQYPKHLKEEEYRTGIENGRLLPGVFQASRENMLEGHVAVNINNEDVHILIQGRESLNRAIHEDEVVIELLPKNLWAAKSDMVILPEANIETEKVEEQVASAVKNLQSFDKNLRPTGKIVAIKKREYRRYTGVLRRHQASLGRAVSTTKSLFIPGDRRIPIIRIETRQYATLKNQRLLVVIDSWPRASRYPQGHYCGSLGTIGDKDTENQVLLIEHDVPHLSFTRAVIDCLPPEGPNWTIPDEEFKKRDDLRSINVCSVDPPGCTDIDDALHYRDLDKKTCEVGVHIADVSYYVKPGTAIDLEAANRGTSVYLSDRRIDMIPELLSSNLCSLIQHQDRLAFSVLWKIQKSTAEVLDVRFTRSIINSKASLTYEKAQEMIDDNRNKGTLHESLRGLNDLAKKLKKQRLDRGALVLARADEIRFVEVESETHDRDSSLEIQHKRLVETNSMVEEFMLLANIAVANKLLQAYPEQALLRRHPRPSRANFDDLIQSAKVKGFEIIPDDGKSLSQSLDKAKLPKNEYFNLMLRMIATRCMTPAAYFCSGFLDPKIMSFTHFGLAADLYTHFTSPIRRYADLLVHRLLAASIGSTKLDKRLQNRTAVQTICDQINYRHRMAQFASRASARLHTVLYIKSKRMLIEEAHVFFVRLNAIQVFIPRIAYEFTYFLQPSDDWQYDPNEKSQTNIVKKLILKQFDKIKVHVSVSTKDDSRFSDRIQVKIMQPPVDEISAEELTTTDNQDDVDESMEQSAIDEVHNDSLMEVQQELAEKDEYIQIKKKLRLGLHERESSKPVIVVPGDTLEKYISKETTIIGPGLMLEDETVVSTKSGILKMRNNNLFWIDCHQKRYVAARGECVIGIVRTKGSLQVRVDINSAELATLSLLAFEGATKRNKPYLNVGDLVYAKVLAADKSAETELVCVNSNGKHDGLGVIGDKGGMLISLSIDCVRVLLSPHCDLLEKLGQIYKYEVAIGMNGRVWIKSSDIGTCVHVSNKLRKFDKE